MKNTIIFLSVVISAIFTWFGYALLASLITYTPLRDCWSDDTVITFLFFSGWILPSLVGFDVYMHLYRHEIRRKKRMDKEVREIETNTFGHGRGRSYVSIQGQLHLN